MTESDQGTAPLGRVSQRSSAATRDASTGRSGSRRPSEARSGNRTGENGKGRPAASATKKSGSGSSSTSGSGPAKRPVAKPRKAQLRLTQVDAWSVMKTAFLLSIALGIVTVVAVGIVWGVLGAAGVFDSLDNTVQTVMGNSFHIQDYIGTGRVLGFTMIVAVVDVVLLTAIATLGAFLYNLSATLLGGVEVTLAEDS